MIEIPTEPVDLIPIAELDVLDRTFCKRAELEAGSIVRRILVERRRAAEGKALADMREAGRTLSLRAVVDRPGEPRMLTTSTLPTLEGRSRP